jgi:hypothetical protein
MPGKASAWWVLAAAAAATIVLVSAVHPTLMKSLESIVLVALMST